MSSHRPPSLSAEERERRRGGFSPLDRLDARHDEPVPWSEVTQTILYDPDQDEVVGNCLQAAVASLLNLPLEAVPHFAQFMWWPNALELWARGRGLMVKGERTTVVPDRLSIVGGTSPRGVMHVVVGYGGEIVWDPHPSRDGLVKITDASWFVEWDNDYGRECWFCRNPWGEMMTDLAEEFAADKAAPS